ncbi:MAG: metal-dependent transcriptional regulator [Brevinematia bacterium]
MGRKSKDNLTRGLKKYLKVIFDIESEKGVVRVKDIADRLGISMSSVSTSLKKLSNMGYVDYEKHFFVKFTFKGKTLADKFHYNFTILSRFFIEVLKIDEATARKQSDDICVDVFDIVVQRIETYLKNSLW